MIVLKRAVGSTDIVTVDFNPREKTLKKTFEGSVGSVHLIVIFDKVICIVPTELQSNSLIYFRGLKSTATKSVEPTALLSRIT